MTTYLYYAEGLDGADPADLLNPIPHGDGMILNGTSITFEWEDVGTIYNLKVGKTKGGGDYANWQGMTNSKTITNLPANGITIFVRLNTYAGGDWEYIDYEFTSDY